MSNWAAMPLAEQARLALLVLAYASLVVAASALAFAAWRAVLPSGGVAFARGLLGRIPAPVDLYAALAARVASAHRAIVEPASARLIVTRRHAVLHKRLDSDRGRLDRELRRIAAANAAGDGAGLADLLHDFGTDTRAATTFSKVDQPYTLDEKRRRLARAESRMFWGLALVVLVANAILLSLFVDNLFGAIIIPGTRINITYVLVLIICAFEFAMGHALETTAESRNRVGQFLIVLVSAGAVAFELYVFYSLARDAADGIDDATSKTLALVGLSSFGPALSIGQIVLSYLAASASRQKTVLDGFASLASQIDRANNFVNKLPARLGDIERAAAAATSSIGEFQTALAGRGALGQKLGTAIDEHRVALLGAIDSVNPLHWDNEPPGTAGDAQDAAGYAWLLAPLAALLIAVFVAAAHPLVATVDLVGAAPVWVGHVVSLAVALAAFVAGIGLFDRVGVSVARGPTRHDVEAPRHDLYRYAAYGFLAIAGLALLTLGWQRDGWRGLPIALFSS